MRKLFPAIIIATLLSFMACGGVLWSGSDFTTKEGFDKNMEMFKTAMADKDPNVYSISFMGEEATSSQLTILRLTGYDPAGSGKDYNYTFVPGGEGNKSVDEDLGLIASRSAKKPEIKFSEINYDKFHEVIQKAISMVPEEVNFKNVYTAKMTVNPDPAKYEYDIEIHATPKTGATEFQGRSIVTNYYELDFEADGAGNVTLKK